MNKELSVYPIPSYPALLRKDTTSWNEDDLRQFPEEAPMRGRGEGGEGRGWGGGGAWMGSGKKEGGEGWDHEYNECAMRITIFQAHTARITRQRTMN